MGQPHHSQPQQIIAQKRARCEGELDPGQGKRIKKLFRLMRIVCP